jgi:hypothetical protein
LEEELSSDCDEESNLNQNERVDEEENEGDFDNMTT